MAFDIPLEADRVSGSTSIIMSVPMIFISFLLNLLLGLLEPRNKEDDEENDDEADFYCSPIMIMPIVTCQDPMIKSALKKKADDDALPRLVRSDIEDFSDDLSHVSSSSHDTTKKELKWADENGHNLVVFF